MQTKSHAPQSYYWPILMDACAHVPLAGEEGFITCSFGLSRESRKGERRASYGSWEEGISRGKKEEGFGFWLSGYRAREVGPFLGIRLWFLSLQHNYGNQ